MKKSKSFGATRAATVVRAVCYRPCSASLDWCGYRRISMAYRDCNTPDWLEVLLAAARVPGWIEAVNIARDYGRPTLAPWGNPLSADISTVRACIIRTIIPWERAAPFIGSQYKRRVRQAKRRAALAKAKQKKGAK